MLARVAAEAGLGATVPWPTYEAETMTISGGTIIGPQYTPNTLAAEASGRQCVQLNATGQSVQFTAQSAANAIVVRYSVPDSSDGTETNYTLSLYTKGVLAARPQVSSKYSWLNGSYPFTNVTTAGSLKNIFHYFRTNGLSLQTGYSFLLP